MANIMKKKSPCNLTEARTKMSSFGDDEELAEELPPNQSLQRLGCRVVPSLMEDIPVWICIHIYYWLKTNGEKNQPFFFPIDRSLVLFLLDSCTIESYDIYCNYESQPVG